jgi:hypothetical protein
MDLGPLPPVRAFTPARELPADFQLTAILEANPAARSGDGSTSGERKKNATASAPGDADELTLAGETETVSEQPAETPDHSINFFA